MNTGLKWKLIAGFVLVFIAGAMTGAFIAASQTRHAGVAENHSVIADRMRHRLQFQLGLTDEQVKKISPAIDQAATQLETVRTETGRRVHEIFREAHREIAVELTPDQRTKLQELEARHRRLLHRARGDRESPAAEATSPAESPTP